MVESLRMRKSISSQHYNADAQFDALSDTTNTLLHYCKQMHSLDNFTRNNMDAAQARCLYASQATPVQKTLEPQAAVHSQHLGSSTDRSVHSMHSTHLCNPPHIVDHTMRKGRCGSHDTHCVPCNCACHCTSCKQTQEGSVASSVAA